MARRLGRPALGRPRGRPRGSPPPGHAQATGQAAAPAAFPGEGAHTLAALALRSPDWLKHRLGVAGPPDELAGFQAAAAGPGIIPWRRDPATLAEGWFNRMVAAPPRERGWSVAGARRLAGQLGDAVASWAAAHEADADRSTGRACPFDLQALVPVPPPVLGLGPDHPDALGWLLTHWGTTWPLRNVLARPVASHAGHERLLLRFHSADWSPWPVLVAMRARWPRLLFELRPDYETPV